MLKDKVYEEGVKWLHSLADTQEYCPVCQRYINASNIEEVESGEYDGYIFVHDDVPHSDEDWEAINRGIQ